MERSSLALGSGPLTRNIHSSMLASSLLPVARSRNTRLINVMCRLPYMVMTKCCACDLCLEYDAPSCSWWLPRIARCSHYALHSTLQLEFWYHHKTLPIQWQTVSSVILHIPCADHMHNTSSITVKCAFTLLRLLLRDLATASRDETNYKR